MSDSLREALLIMLANGIVTAAVTWGVIATKLEWMRRDIDELKEWRAYMERRA